MNCRVRWAVPLNMWTPLTNRTIVQHCAERSVALFPPALTHVCTRCSCRFPVFDIRFTINRAGRCFYSRVCERQYVCVCVGVGVGWGRGAACNRLWVTVGPSVVIQTESNTQLEKLSRNPDLRIPLAPTSCPLSLMHVHSHTCAALNIHLVCVRIYLKRCLITNACK